MQNKMILLYLWATAQMWIQLKRFTSSWTDISKSVWSESVHEDVLRGSLDVFRQRAVSFPTFALCGVESLAGCFFFLIRSTFVTPLRARVTPETSKSIVAVLQLRSLVTLGADPTSLRSLGTDSALMKPNERSWLGSNCDLLFLRRALALRIIAEDEINVVNCPIFIRIIWRRQRLH